MKKIGFFGGTFDPIHFGHINLAIELQEKCHLDEVLFCPARTSPFKKKSKPIASPDHRASMIELSLQNIPSFKLTRIEIDHSKLSYTIDTLVTIAKTLDSEKEQLYLLLSDDTAQQFHLWKDFEQIVEIAKPLVGLRKKIPIPGSAVQGILQENLIATRQMEISSTNIRDRLKQNLYCGHLLFQEVIEYAKVHDLYAN